MAHVDNDEKTRELRAALDQLLRQLDVSEPDIHLPELREHVQTVLRRLDEDMRRMPFASPLARFERIRELQPYIDQIDERWAAIRRAAGQEAAEDILRNEAPSEGEIEAAWHRRWQDWTPFAWAEREHLKRQVGESKSRMQFERTSRVGAMSDVMVTALDLRYVSGFPLARIADFINVSPTAIQFRLADFERDVANGIVRNSVEGQLPTGYYLSRRGPSELLVRLRPSDDERRRADSLMIEVVSAWEDGENSSGRMKDAPAPRLRSTWKFEPTYIVWAVVLTSGPRVLFLSEQDLFNHGVTRTSLARIIESAQEFGHESLSSVLPDHWDQTTQAQLKFDIRPDREEEL